MALVPYLDQQRLQLLEDKLKQLFAMVIDAKLDEELIHLCSFAFSEGWQRQTKCLEEILSNSGRAMLTINTCCAAISQWPSFECSTRSSSYFVVEIPISIERSASCSTQTGSDVYLRSCLLAAASLRL